MSAEEYELINTKLDYVKEKIDEVHDQQVKTNGRVTALESWRDRIIGGITILTILILPVLISVINTWIMK
jgi:ribosomal 50S subunit-associated protein YjgA (DUF615 family)